MTPAAWANWAKDKARNVAREYGQAKGIRYLQGEGFFDPDFHSLPGSILLNDVCIWVGKGNGAVARAAIREMKDLFAVPPRPVSPGVLAEWMRAYQAFAEGQQLTPSDWPEAKISATSKLGTMVVTPMLRHPRVRLYVTAEPYWAGLRVGEWEPRPGRQNAPA